MNIYDVLVVITPLQFTTILQLKKYSYYSWNTYSYHTHTHTYIYIHAIIPFVLLSHYHRICCQFFWAFESHIIIPYYYPILFHHNLGFPFESARRPWSQTPSGSSSALPCAVRWRWTRRATLRRSSGMGAWSLGALGMEVLGCSQNWNVYPVNIFIRIS